MNKDLKNNFKYNLKHDVNHNLNYSLSHKLVNLTKNEVFVKFTKKANIPFWLVMLIYSLIGLIAVIIIIYLARGKLGEFLANIF